MIVTCPKCLARYDDVYRWTYCPHDTFAANDGQNSFAHHPESFYEPPPPRWFSRLARWFIRRKLG